MDHIIYWSSTTTRNSERLSQDILARNGYRVSVAQNGVVMMQTLAVARVDLVILDIRMPGESGLSLCRKLRAAGTMPIIMLTALRTETDRVIGLEMGADDYLSKPFGRRELLARIRARCCVVRRCPRLGQQPEVAACSSSPAGGVSMRR